MSEHASTQEPARGAMMGIVSSQRRFDLPNLNEIWFVERGRNNPPELTKGYAGRAEGVSLEASTSCNEVFSRGFKLRGQRYKLKRGGGCEWAPLFPSTAAPRVEKRFATRNAH